MSVRKLLVHLSCCLGILSSGLVANAADTSSPAETSSAETSGPAETSKPAGSSANADAATITQVEGEVRVLLVPVREHLKRSGIYSRLNRYYAGGKDAEVGMTVESDSLIVTKEDGHARIVFPNGDQLVLGPKVSSGWLGHPRRRASLNSPGAP